MTAGTVMHVVPYDLARGAQAYARDLVRALDSDDQAHIIVTLFEPEDAILEPDVALDVPRGLLRRAGLDPRVVWRLRRSCRSRSPVAVVAHGGESAKYCALALPRSVPFVYLKIGSEHPGMTRRISQATHRYSTRRADRIVAVSNVVADELRQLHGVADDRLAVIPNGRDSSVFRPGSPRSGLPVQLLNVGYLEPGKRPELFVDLVGEIKAAGHEVAASLVGGGELDGQTLSRASELGVELLGVRGDVPGLLANSDILVFVGRPPEGMPGVLIEAGLSGLPVVTTSVPGAADVIEDGVTGFVVDVDDHDGLRNALIDLIEDPELRHAMGVAARRRCLALFSLDSSAELWRALLNELVG